MQDYRAQNARKRRRSGNLRQFAARYDIFLAREDFGNADVLLNHANVFQALPLRNFCEFQNGHIWTYFNVLVIQLKIKTGQLLSVAITIGSKRLHR